HFFTNTEFLITGEGSLTVLDTEDYGIIGDPFSLITIKDTVVTISNCGDGIGGKTGLEIDNSTVTASVSGYGIVVSDATISDSKVDLTAGEIGIYAFDGELSVSKDSYVSVDAKGSNAKTDAVAIYASENIDIADLDIIEPEDGKIVSAVVESFNSEPRYYVFDKDDNVAAKAVIAKTYTIKFINYNGSVLQEKKTPINEVPKYEGNTPTRKSDGSYIYTFKGWNKEITAVKGDETYKAVYDKTPVSVPDPEPTPTMPFKIPNTGIEGPSSSCHLISILGVCTLGIFLTRKKRS
ncbi:MAG: carbohydrate-binding domain-containing protein, partial [Erysipelotrichaceae bacterium]|nr:carbohydrate-binding domain-containing protein [Erysipelotrichaceae bacterium]